MHYYIVNGAFPVRVSDTGATDIFAQDETWHPTSLDLRTVESHREITEAEALSFWEHAEEFDRLAAEIEAMGQRPWTEDDEDAVHVIIPARPPSAPRT